MTTLNITIHPAPEPPPPSTRSFWRVTGDEGCPDWGFESRTLTVRSPVTGELFNELPAVYGYSPEPAVKPNDYRVNEEPLRSAYVALNNYDGQGQVRCENYLWKDNTALYNKKGFPERELLTMSGNLLEEIGWETWNGQRYLKFHTLKPADNVSGMTYETHPWFVHRFTLVYWDALQEVTRYKFNTPRGLIYYYLTSLDGFGYMPERYVRR